MRMIERLNRLERTTGSHASDGWMLCVRIGGSDDAPRTYARTESTGETSTDYDLITQLRHSVRTSGDIAVNINGAMPDDGGADG